MEQLRWTLFTSCVVLGMQVYFSGLCSHHWPRGESNNISYALWGYGDDEMETHKGGTLLMLANAFSENHVRAFFKHRGHCRADRFALINTWPTAGSLLQELAWCTSIKD